MQTGRLFSALVKFLLLVLSAAVLLQLAKVVLPWAAPFLVALALARLVQAPAAFLIRRLRLPRKAACTLCLLAVAAAAAGLGFLAAQRLWQEVTQLVDALPSLIAALPVSDGRLEGWLYRLTMAAPVQYQQALSQLPQRLMDALSAIPEALSQASLTAAGELASSAPAIALFCLTTLMAAYFTSVSLPALPGLLQRMLPPAWYRSLARIGHISLDVAGGWLRVQGILLCVTFACLSGASGPADPAVPSGGGPDHAGGRPSPAGGRGGAGPMESSVSAVRASGPGDRTAGSVRRYYAAAQHPGAPADGQKHGAAAFGGAGRHVRRFLRCGGLGTAAGPASAGTAAGSAPGGCFPAGTGG